MSGYYLETVVEHQFHTVEEAVAFGKQMDCYGSTPALPDSIVRDKTTGLIVIRKYHAHAVVTSYEVYEKLKASFQLPALFPNQSFVWVS